MGNRWRVVPFPVTEGPPAGGTPLANRSRFSRQWTTRLCKPLRLGRHPGSEGPAQVRTGYGGTSEQRGRRGQPSPYFGQEKAYQVSVDWGEVYRGSFEELVRFLHRKVWDAERARDLAQEVFVRALRHEPENPRAWLFRVATNLAHDEARTVLRRKRHLALLRIETEKEEGVPGSDELVLAEEEWAQVRAALDALNPRDREVLLLWDAGLSYREIAEVTDLAASAIGTTLARARRRLVEAHGEMEKEHAARN